jgi:hypothetical protein
MSHLPHRRGLPVRHRPRHPDGGVVEISHTARHRRPRNDGDEVLGSGWRLDLLARTVRLRLHRRPAAVDLTARR